jgi:hypothetical protein
MRLSSRSFRFDKSAIQLKLDPQWRLTPEAIAFKPGTTALAYKSDFSINPQIQDPPLLFRAWNLDPDPLQ